MAQLEPVEEPEPAEDDGDKWGDEDEVVRCGFSSGDAAGDLC
jgi:hypothetical protein